MGSAAEWLCLASLAVISTQLGRIIWLLERTPAARKEGDDAQ